MQNIRLIPLLIIVALFSFAVRVGDIVTEVKTKEQAMSVSITAEETKANPEEEKKESVDVPEGLTENDPLPIPANEWADPATLDLEFSETQTLVLKELKERRIALDERDKKLAQRDAMLKVTEQRIEEKIAELNVLRESIEDLLGKQSEEEKARMQSLVKIYSGMKPKEAANIFDDLDMSILLQVVSGMSERKSAPILAAMDVRKAQELTTLLAEQKKLPDLPE